jgi:hypothetical protein
MHGVFFGKTDMIIIVKYKAHGVSRKFFSWEPERPIIDHRLVLW